MQIFKYELTSKVVKFCFKPGARILSVGEQRNKPYAWIMVDPVGAADVAACTTLIQVETYVTGEEVSEPSRLLRFIGRIMLDGGALVLHVFERHQAGDPI